MPRANRLARRPDGEALLADPAVDRARRRPARRGGAPAGSCRCRPGRRGRRSRRARAGARPAPSGACTRSPAAARRSGRERRGARPVVDVVADHRGAPARARVRPAVARSNTRLPLRSTVTRSAISNTSSRRCETKRTSRPRRFSSAMIANRRRPLLGREHRGRLVEDQDRAPRSTARGRSRRAGARRR